MRSRNVRVSQLYLYDLEDTLDQQRKRIADLESKLAAAVEWNQEMVRIAASKDRPAYDEQQRRIMALEERLAAAERDAGRYRWVRERAWYVDAAVDVFELSKSDLYRYDHPHHVGADDVEAAIDAAIHCPGSGDATEEVG